MNRPSISKWKKFFLDRGISPELTEQYLLYIRTLNASNVPVIFEFEHLSALLGVKKSYLASVVNSPSNHYREFQIPKRRGGSRRITAPYPALKYMQSWIQTNILSTIPIHPSAHGFVPRKSIITNARKHKGAKDLLKMDIQDFFGSIDIARIIAEFSNLGYTHPVSYYLSAICCLDDALPQGSPASPTLSNAVSIVMDKRLHSVAKSFGLQYTRYADDLAFSGNHIPLKFPNIVQSILNDNDLLPNPDKTRLVRGAGRRKILTGLDVTGDTLKLPRQFRREVRQQIYYVKKYGFYSHVSKLKVRDPGYAFSLLGKLYYWRQFEPNNDDVIQGIAYLENLLRSPL